MTSGKLIIAFLGAFASLFGAGYLFGLADRDEKALADIYSSIVPVPEGTRISYRFTCQSKLDAPTAPPEVTYDPFLAADDAGGQPRVSAAMRGYVGRRPGIRIPVSKEAISALVGGASGGVTLKSIRSIANEMSVRSDISPFEWRRLPWKEKALRNSRKFQRVGMMVLGGVSGYSAGYLLATRNARCSSSSALASIQTKEFWKSYVRFHASMAIASVLKETSNCQSVRLQDLIGRVDAHFEPTADDLAFLDGLATEVECATRPGKWSVFDKRMCSGSVDDSDRTFINACSAVSDNLPPDIAAWRDIRKSCSEMSTSDNEDVHDRESLAKICGTENPRYLYLKEKYAKEPMALMQIESAQ